MARRASSGSTFSRRATLTAAKNTSPISSNTCAGGSVSGATSPTSASASFSSRTSSRSPEGYYYKDHRSSPGREYEFIEFESPVDIREVEASVNFYKGDCPGGPRGEVRIEFDGRIYGATFSIPSSEGNQGRSGRSQQDFWTRIPVKEILKITAAAERAG